MGACSGHSSSSPKSGAAGISNTCVPYELLERVLAAFLEVLGGVIGVSVRTSAERVSRSRSCIELQLSALAFRKPTFGRKGTNIGCFPRAILVLAVLATLAALALLDRQKRVHIARPIHHLAPKSVGEVLTGVQR